MKRVAVVYAMVLGLAAGAAELACGGNEKPPLTPDAVDVPVDPPDGGPAADASPPAK